MLELVQAKDCEAEILIAGRACRLPGAPSIAAFWDVLRERRCTIGEVGPGRWPRGRYLHPRPGEPGKTYTFRAGTLDDPWSFDPAPFGISPREAAQIDPQQRLALELVWEALEDAGVPPSQVAGTRVGVYVGASSVDHGSRRVFDAAGGDGYYMTGSALSLIANRISHAFDFTGPSLVIDTACSSSLVALHEALTTLRAGLIDAAVVAGVNILLSPFPFIGFAQARMLSPDGFCRAFAAGADGYVRSEGGVALVLMRAGAVGFGRVRPHARMVASGVSSDGRTVGVSLPSAVAQGRLLGSIYAEAGIDPAHLAFVEAHGTGTRVGDPIEAQALGQALGRRRRAPLPIGSVKSNVGHLEPAAGLVGLLKASLALEHDILPATLHADELNPDIPFAELNLLVARQPMELAPARRPRLAGISTFGFGGTNAHVIIADCRETQDVRRPLARRGLNGACTGTAMAHLGTLLSAETGPALAAAAEQLAARTKAAEADIETMRSAIAHHRELLAERAVVLGDPAPGLAALGSGSTSPRLVRGRAIARAAPVAFVFCGNGAQWVGMGRTALANDPIFARHVTALDAMVRRETGWSITDMLASGDLGEALKFTSIAQPLLFALQAAAADTLRDRGLEPAMVIGHSVGEVAAAYVAGHYDRRQAVRLVLARSAAQEFARGRGRMAVLHAGVEDARRLIAQCGGRDVEIAALNSPASVTLVGPAEMLGAVLDAAAARGFACRVLDIDYPFHSRAMDGARRRLAVDLGKLVASPGSATLISTVTGRPLEAKELHADYWWRNVRRPVRFADAVAQAAALGAGVFVEIGPRPVLKAYLDQCLKAAGASYAVVPTFTRDDELEIDALAVATARAIVSGAQFDAVRAFGPPPAGGWRDLPHYPWQRAHLMSPDTAEKLGGVETDLSGADADGLIGHRAAGDVLVWHSHMDTIAWPELDDHRVAGQPWLPAAAFVDMALAAAQTWLGQAQVELRDLDIVRPLALAAQPTMDVRTRIDPETATCEIASRSRLSDDIWQVHMRCRVAVFAGSAGDAETDEQASLGERTLCAEDVYARAEAIGLSYGPAFRRLGEVVSSCNGSLRAAFDPAAGAWPRGFVLAPCDLDGAFHGLLAFDAYSEQASPARVLVPVRLGRVRVFRPGVRAAGAVITRIAARGEGLACGLALLDAEGASVARIEDAYMAPLILRPERDMEHVAFRIAGRRHIDAKRATSALPDVRSIRARLDDLPARIRGLSEEAILLLDAAAQRAAYDALAIGDGTGEPDVASERDPQHALACAIARDGALIEISDEGRERLVASCPIPPLDRIVSTLVAEHPELGAECALLADAAAALADGGAWVPATATWQHVRRDSPRARAERAHVQAAVELLHECWPEDRPLRVLQIGAEVQLMPSAWATRLARAGRLRLAIADVDGGALAALRADMLPDEVALIELDEDGRAELVGRGPFDIVIGANALHRLDGGGLSAVCKSMAARGMLFAIEPDAGAFNEFIFGFADGRCALGRRLRSGAQWCEALERAGLKDVEARRRADLGGAIVLTAVAGAVRTVGAAGDRAASDEASAPKRHARILARDRCRAAPFAARLKAALGARSPMALAGAEGELYCGIDAIVLAGTGGAIDDPQRAIVDMMALMQSTLARSDAAPGRVWIVAPGGARHLVGEGAVDAVASAVWAFMRTVANEHPGIDFRLVDFSDALDEATVAMRLAELVAAPGNEAEIVLTNDGHVALRVVSGVTPPHQSAPRAEADTAVRLALERPGVPQSLAWREVGRRAPDDDEVEIAVAATGLNFRDVMWAAGMLPAEALDGGFAGMTIGFECAGIVARKGARVAHLDVGDRVFAVAPAAFSSHVTVAASAAGRLPEGIDLVAAASVPVAFLTAHYALSRVAQLRAGEWVLIHGGAGGVGLAALQIAQSIGARTIVTAGTREKRALLRLLGAEHVLSSRSLDFEDGVRAIAPEGVHVVLNTLAGAAMERSLELVRPFGRFLELGKRDYYENTKIALRPFRRNVAYFGIDVDQLMQHEPMLAAEMMQTLSTRLARGELRPLPHRCFAADEVHSAFRLMQQSGHIGKIVVTPPTALPASASRQAESFAVSSAGAHLVIGGLGGFGLATAAWLARRGARTIVLASRRGVADAAGEATIAQLRAGGVDVMIEACDAADENALAALLFRLRAAGHTLRSVFHCAMVIEDATLANLSTDAAARVLAPKVDGARHIDRLTRDSGLDHFVLYSSATTLFGNPGQAAYVAANGYLEGIAHARRAAGLPALAIAWGAISNAGYVARSTGSRARLDARIEARLEAAAMTAEEALRHLEAVLANPVGAPPVVTLAPLDWPGMARLLPMLKRPTFAALSALRDGDEGEETSDDPLVEINGLDTGEAVAVLARHLARVVGKVMRAPATAIDTSRPLADMGIDSLMTIELQFAAKQRFGVELPLGALVGGASIEDLAARLLQRLRGGIVAAGEADRVLLSKHIEGPERAVQAVAAQ